MSAIHTEGLRKVYPVAAGKRRGGSPPGMGFGPPGAGSPPTAGVSGTRELVALEGLDLVIHDGEFFGLLGPNGAGKTTTIGILTTRIVASGGRASVAGAIVMTTHYMEEADQLCDRLAIIDRGRLLALDTTAALKARAPGGTRIELALDGPATDAAARVRTLEHVSKAEAVGDNLRIHSAAGGRIISACIEAIEGAGRQVSNITLEEPSLETLFIELTGRKLD